MTRKLTLFACLFAGMALMQSCTKETDSQATVSDQTLSRMASDNSGFTYMPASTMSTSKIKMNSIAAAARSTGNYPSNSMIVKEKYDAQGTLTGYDIMYRSSADHNSSGGWVWTSSDVHGNITYGSENRGASCQNCHSSQGFVSRY
ncbi:MAG: cytochrome P460 family protein [Bacteroidia bacterium]